MIQIVASGDQTPSPLSISSSLGSSPQKHEAVLTTILPELQASPYSSKGRRRIWTSRDAISGLIVQTDLCSEASEACTLSLQPCGGLDHQLAIHQFCPA